MERPKQARGLKTKKKILSIALKLFTEKGYDNVTVDTIVRESNSSKGAFYFHFKSKDAILLEKFEEIDNYYIKIFNEFSEELTSLEKIALFVNKQMTYIQNELGSDLMQIIYSNALQEGKNDYFINQKRPMFTILESLIREGQQKEEITKDLTVESIKLILTQGLMGSIYHWCMNNGSYNLTQKSDTFFAAIIKGIES